MRRVVFILAWIVVAMGMLHGQSLNVNDNAQIEPQRQLAAPWVRWWWNGDKVDTIELKRELHLLHEAGIGGVEINPIEFPAKRCDSLGIRSLTWLSDEWLDKVTDNTHESAYAAFYRSMVYDKLGNHDMVCYWLGKSALDDIKCAVKDQASLLFLAEHLANDGDISRARRYVEFAKDCNYFFCPHLRNYQVNSVINVIEKSNQATQSRANLILIIATILIVLLLIVLAYTVFRLKRK